MLAFFPGAYEGELFASICARFSDLVEFPGGQAIVLALFGKDDVAPSIAFPSGLDALCARLPWAEPESADRYIDAHTLYPLFAAFLPPERALQLRQSMRGSGVGRGGFLRLGNLARHVVEPQWLRFCPGCVEEDRARLKECYWHRVHQVAGVLVCPEHGLFLEESAVPIRMRSRGFVSAERAITADLLEGRRLIRVTNPDHQVLLTLARDVAWLLERPRSASDPETLRRQYVDALQRQGLASTSRRGKGSLIWTRRLVEAFSQRFMDSLLTALGCQLAGPSRPYATWVARLVAGDRAAQHPLHHLLVMQFLEGSAEWFLSVAPRQLPSFGSGPWPCLNPVSAHRGELTIAECTVRSRSWGRERAREDGAVQTSQGSVLGTFACLRCGFTYRRVGPEVEDGQCWRYSTVETYGHEWEAVLCSPWGDASLGLKGPNGLAKRMGVAPATILYQAARLGLPLPRPGGKMEAPKSAKRFQRHAERQRKEQDSLRRRHRAAWRAARRAYPELGTAALSTHAPSSLAWLRRHDADWLSKQLPPGQWRPKTVDWPARDVTLASAVMDVAERLRNAPGRPVWITRGLLCQHIPSGGFMHVHHKQLPLTEAALDAAVETAEEYALRRLAWAKQSYLEEGCCPVRWRLVARASLRRGVAATSPTVQAALEAALDELRAVCHPCP
jgi:Tn7-like transposition protein D/TniQ